MLQIYLHPCKLVWLMRILILQGNYLDRAFCYICVPHRERCLQLLHNEDDKIVVYCYVTDVTQRIAVCFVNYINITVVLLLSHICRCQRNDTHFEPHVQCPRFESNSNQIWLFSTDFPNNFKRIVRKLLQWEPSLCVWTDGLTYAMKPTGTFRDTPWTCWNNKLGTLVS